MDFRVLADDPCVLAVPRGGDMDANGAVAWADVDPARFIAVWKDSGNRMLIDSGLAHARETAPWAYEVRHLSTSLGLVEAGLGITAVPASAISGPEHPLLRACPPIKPEVTRTIGAVRHAGARLSPAAEAFYETVIAGASKR